MTGGSVVKKAVVSLASTATVEARKADIETRGTIDRVKALGAVFSVHRLVWPWRL